MCSVASAPGRLWHRLLGGQCLSLADYVAVTGTRGGATAAGGPFMLPSLYAPPHRPAWSRRVHGRWRTTSGLAEARGPLEAVAGPSAVSGIICRSGKSDRPHRIRQRAGNRLHAVNKRTRLV